MQLAGGVRMSLAGAVATKHVSWPLAVLCVASLFAAAAVAAAGAACWLLVIVCCCTPPCMHVLDASNTAMRVCLCIVPLAS